MIKDIVDAAGTGLLIPAILVAMLVATIRGLYGLFGRKGQTRKEFIELWDAGRTGDDLWLEVTVRHLFGEYLPADVIRLALRQPHSSNALREIASIWPLLEVDCITQQVYWRRAHHRSQRGRVVGHWIQLVGYFVCFLLAFAAGWIHTRSEPNSVNAWTYGTLTVMALVFALFCLMNRDELQTAAQVGDAWVGRINAIRSTPPSHPQAEPGNSLSITASQ